MSPEELHRMMASLAELTRASFEEPRTPGGNAGFERTRAPEPPRHQARQAQPENPRKSQPGNLPGNLEDPRVREALSQLQRRREASRASSPQGPKIINSHYRAVSSPSGLENARIHFPRKPHG